MQSLCYGIRTINIVLYQGSGCILMYRMSTWSETGNIFIHTFIFIHLCVHLFASRNAVVQ